MKRVLLWLAGILVALVAMVVLAFQLSPWPSVFIIAHMFAGNDMASEEALAKHVPPGIVTRRNIAYGEGKDEVLDVYFREGTTSGPQPTIVWVHGGGWIGGSKDGVANYLRVLAGHRYTTVGVEYSTGFGSKYPKPVRQVNAALGYLVRNAEKLNIDPKRFVLAGDSAGAQISAQVAVITTDAAYARRMGISPSMPPDGLAAILLLSGAYSLDSIKLDGEYGWFLRTVLWAYSGMKDFLKDEQFKLLSVTNYVTPAFPPAFISSGNGDPLAPQAVALAKKLGSLGAKTDSFFFPPDYKPALQHEYQFNLDIVPG